jgi:hypothetical protein
MSLASVNILLIAKTLSLTSAAQAYGNPLSRNERVPVGTTYFTGVRVVAGFDRRDSNIGYTVYEFDGQMVHNLADPTDEDAYMNSTMLTDQQVLMDPDFFRVAGVYEVISVPELTPPERTGNVIEYSVTVQLALS